MTNIQQNTAKSHEIVQKIVVAMSTTNYIYKINKHHRTYEQTNKNNFKIKFNFNLKLLNLK